MILLGLSLRLLIRSVDLDWRWLVFFLRDFFNFYFRRCFFMKKLFLVFVCFCAAVDLFILFYGRVIKRCLEIYLLK